LLLAGGIILLLIAYLFMRAYKYNKVLLEKNRLLLNDIELHEKEEIARMNTLQAQPEETLTSEQKLYRRLCTIMVEQQPYTEETLNRDVLAQMLGTNAKYVVQAIHECSNGDTVGEFINRYRLEHVARLLKTTDDPISIIGELSGIPSRVTLARIFRNAYGMTCSEYRQAVKSKAT
jgi:AraC-like DNA-binding protein